MGWAQTNFDLDRYLNRIVPRSRLHLLPSSVSWLLGYRHDPAPQIGNVLAWAWAFVGAFSGILVVEAVFHAESLQAEGVPMVIASLGAAAILEYHTIDSPLAQPRNAMLGQIFSATIGIGISKLFHLSPRFEALRWVAGALSVGVASAFMGLTKTIHPPAGATALICSSDPAIVALGWFFLPMVILGTALLLAVALVVNNIQRQFPVYWWTPADLRSGEDEIERIPSHRARKSIERKSTEERERVSGSVTPVAVDDQIIVERERITVPDWIALGYEERAMLELLQAKLRNGYVGEGETFP